MSSWSSWIPLLIHSVISIISIHFLFKLCSRIAKNVNNQIQETSTITANNKDTSQQLCERCGANILASSAVKRQQKIYQNNNQIKYKTFDDESYRRRCGMVDGKNGENEQESSGDGLSSDDDQKNIVGQQLVSTREVISYDRPSENNKKILEVCHTKNTVSMLRKQFENVDKKKTIRNLERQISEKFFKRATSPIRSTSRNDIDEMTGTEPSTNDYYVIEKTKVYKVVNNGKCENVKGVEPSSTLLPTADKISKKNLSKRSHSNGDIKRLRRSPSHDVIAEEPFVLNERTKSMEQMTEDADDIEYRRSGVRTVDDILQQERFSKCYSEYSISDLISDLPDDDDSEFA